MAFCSRCISVSYATAAIAIVLRLVFVLLLQESCSPCQLYQHCVLCAKDMNTTDCSNCTDIATRLVPGNQYDSTVGMLCSWSAIMTCSVSVQIV